MGPEYKPKSWTLHFPWMPCPHCGLKIGVAYYGGRYKFWKVGAGRKRKPKAPFPETPQPAVQ